MPRARSSPEAGRRARLPVRVERVYAPDLRQAAAALLALLGLSLGRDRADPFDAARMPDAARCTAAPVSDEAGAEDDTIPTPL